MLKQYKIGFDLWGLLLFFTIMIPNFIWFVVPAPNDVVRGTSITVTLDTIASICQVGMVSALCILIHREQKRTVMTPLIITVHVLCIVYAIAIGFIAIFTICHFLYRVLNFII